MSIKQELREYLDEQQIPYTVLHHDHQTFTAQETAGAQHISGDCVAKPVLVDVGGELIMAVLPATYRIDWDKFASVRSGQKPRLATEEQLAELFPEYELGAVPPLGALCHDIPLYVDSHLAQQSNVAFLGGTHRDMVEMPWESYREICDASAIQDFGSHV